MPHDWQTRYGHRPLLLETLVDATRFPGTCYRAANWICVGQTAGRGRMDREHKSLGQTIKDIYVYPLVRDPRQYLCGYSLQRKVMHNLVVEASYVGNRGVWWTAPLLATQNYNAFTPEGLLDGLSVTHRTQAWEPRKGFAIACPTCRRKWGIFKRRKRGI